MTKKNDGILVFEYFTASGEKDKSIISEAESLIFSLLEELKDFKINLIIDKTYKNKIKYSNNVRPIFIDCDVIEWLKINAAKFKKAIFIAAENNNNLFNITKILEDNNVELYVSSSNACLNCSDKYKTYLNLKNIIPQPKSSKINIDNDGQWKKNVLDFYKEFGKLIVKPLSGVDCENIIVIDNVDDLYLIENSFSGVNVLIQQFIQGDDVSVSLLSDGVNVIPLSLNKQFIELNNDGASYLGGKLPFENKYEKQSFEIAIKAVKSIDGIKGFVGVDLKINEASVNFLEINSRFTTPYTGLTEVSNINIAKTVIDLIDKKINVDDLNISLDGEVEFKKSKNSLDIRRI